MNFESKLPDLEIDRLAQLPLVSVYNTNGKRIFLGTPMQLAVVWRNKDFGSNPSIGDISDGSGASVIRFGPVDNDRFFSRARISEVFDALSSRVNDSNDVLNSQDSSTADRVRDALRTPDAADPKQAVIDAYSKIYFANRWSLRDSMFLCARSQKQDGSLYEKVDGEVGQYFDAHGITKDDQVKALLYLLEHGIDPSRDFYTAPFEVSDENKRLFGAALGTSGGTAYKDGVAVIVGGYKKRLTDGIEFVFINDAVGAMIEPLKRAFPQYKFYLLSEQKQVLEGALD